LPSLPGSAPSRTDVLERSRLDNMDVLLRFCGTTRYARCRTSLSWITSLHALHSTRSCVVYRACLYLTIPVGNTPFFLARHAASYAVARLPHTLYGTSRRGAYFNSIVFCARNAPATVLLPRAYASTMCRTARCNHAVCCTSHCNANNTFCVLSPALTTCLAAAPRLTRIAARTQQQRWFRCRAIWTRAAPVTHKHRVAVTDLPPARLWFAAALVVRALPYLLFPLPCAPWFIILPLYLPISIVARLFACAYFYAPCCPHLLPPASGFSPLPASLASP